MPGTLPGRKESHYGNSLVQRFRLRFVWLLTRHRRFKPLYHADVVNGDLLEQAEFLASAGYYVAAAMLARLAVESRVKRLAMISKQWREFSKNKKMTVPAMANKLEIYGHLGKVDKCARLMPFTASPAASRMATR